MKNWKFKITFFILVLLILVTTNFFSYKHVFAADVCSNSSQSVANICYDLQKTNSLLANGKNANGTPLTDDQRKLLQEQANQIQSIYNNAKTAQNDSNLTESQKSQQLSNYENLAYGYYQKGLDSTGKTDQQVAGNTYDSAANTGSQTQCYSTSYGIPYINSVACVRDVYSYVALAIITGVSFFVGITGLLFDSTLSYTVVNIKSHLTALPIEQAWVLFRDLGNFIFIAVLVYIAIKTILGLDNGNTKQLIRNVIIIGLLVNFSLFFTKFLIDASNILSLAFYNKILGGVNTSTASAIDTAKSFSVAFVRPLGIQTIPNGGIDASNFIKLFQSGSNGGDFTKITIYLIGGSVFLVFIAFSLLYASILFIIRYLAIILILIISPLAFFAYVIPATRKYFDQWKNTLIGMLAFAPLYLILMFLVLAISTQLLGGQQVDLSSALSGPTGSNIQSVLSFILVIGLINAAAILATKVAASSGGLVTAAVNKARGYALPSNVVTRGTLATSAKLGRAYIGGTANAQLKEGNATYEKLMRDSASSNIITRNRARLGLAARKTLADATYDVRNTKTFQNIAGSKAAKSAYFDVGKGQRNYQDSVEETKKRVLTDAKSRGGATAETQEKLSGANQRVKEAKSIITDSQIHISRLESEKAKLKEGDAGISDYDTKINELKRASYDAQKSLRVAEKDKNDADKKRKEEIANQQLLFVKRQADSRFKRTGAYENYLEPQAGYGSALSEIAQKAGPKDNEKEKFELDDYKNRLKEAEKINDIQEINRLLNSEIKKEKISKLSGDVFTSKTTKTENVIDAKGNTVEIKKDVYTPNKVILDQLSTNQIKSLESNKQFAGGQSDALVTYRQEREAVERRAKEDEKKKSEPKADDTKDKEDEEKRKKLDEMKKRAKKSYNYPRKK